MTLPASRVVNVTVTATDAPLSRQGFGIPLFLTSTAKADVLDATHLTRAYSSMDEVSDEWDAADDFYKAAAQAFSQNPRPLTIKAGFYDATAATTGALLKDALDDILDADRDWFWLSVETALRDDAKLDDLFAWALANDRFAMVTSNDAAMTDPADTTNVAARNKGTSDHYAVIYSTTATDYPGFALAASLGTYDFDNPETAYTAAFKDLEGLTLSALRSAEVNAVTGQAPGQPSKTDVGHIANVFVDIGGRRTVLPGQTGKPGVFIDEVHARHWLIARCQEQVQGYLASNARVPFTDVGLDALAGQVRIVGQEARRAGIVAEDLDPVTGDYRSSFVVESPVIADATDAERQARIAPPIKVTFRYAGAVHYVTVAISVRF